MCHLPSPHYKKAENIFELCMQKRPSKDAKGLQKMQKGLQKMQKAFFPTPFD
jgi:hypothetical protein